MLVHKRQKIYAEGAFIYGYTSDLNTFTPLTFKRVQRGQEFPSEIGEGAVMVLLVFVLLSCLVWKALAILCLKCGHANKAPLYCIVLFCIVIALLQT